MVWIWAMTRPYKRTVSVTSSSGGGGGGGGDGKLGDKPPLRVNIQDSEYAERQRERRTDTMKAGNLRSSGGGPADDLEDVSSSGGEDFVGSDSDSLRRRRFRRRKRSKFFAAGEESSLQDKVGAKHSSVSGFEDDDDVIVIDEDGERLDKEPSTKRVVPDPEMEELCMYQRQAITLHDYRTLADGEYLNDAIINFYLTFLHEHLHPDHRQLVHIYSSHFYSRLKG